jgi:opacity protein-like surface antigen
MKSALALAGAVVLSLLHVQQLTSQLTQARLPGSGDIATIAIHYGAVDPQTTFDDGSSFLRGSTLGLSATAWAFRHLGFRGNVYKSHNDGHNPQNPTAAIAVQDPDIWLYSGEVVLRYPINTDALSVSPYVGAGFGGKTYDWQVKTVGNVWRAWTQSVGVDLRPAAMGRVGLITEVRHYRSDFKAFGYEVYYWHEAAIGMVEDQKSHWGESTTHSDLVLTAGFSVNF